LGVRTKTLGIACTGHHRSSASAAETRPTPSTATAKNKTRVTRVPCVSPASDLVFIARNNPGSRPSLVEAPENATQRFNRSRSHPTAQLTDPIFCKGCSPSTAGCAETVLRRVPRCGGNQPRTQLIHDTETLVRPYRYRCRLCVQRVRQTRRCASSQNRSRGAHSDARTASGRSRSRSRSRGTRSGPSARPG